MRYDLMAVIGLLVVMWASCLGCGLALERVLRVRLPNALLLPLGLCVSLVLTFPGYVAGAGDALAISLLVAVALAGLAFARGGLRARLNPGWPGAAGLGVYVLYMLPVIAHGHWTWSGYDFVNDSAFEMLLANHAKAFGTVLGNIPESSEREFLASYLNSGYPLGTQTLLGTFSGLTVTPVEVLYQGFIAFLAGSGAVALATVPRKLLSARRAAVVAFLAIAANLTYQYALQGGIKEIGLLATLCATVALAREAIALDRPYTGAVLVAVGAAAALATYNAVAAPFLGALVLFIGLGVLLIGAHAPSRTREARLPVTQRAGRWLGPLAGGLVLTAVLAIPSLMSFQTFFNVARAGQGATGVGSAQFGQLLRALPLSQLSGVWLAGEYRAPVVPEPAATLTVIATVVILLLAHSSRALGAAPPRAGPAAASGDGRPGAADRLPAREPLCQGKAAGDREPGGRPRRTGRADGRTGARGPCGAPRCWSARHRDPRVGPARLQSRDGRPDESHGGDPPDRRPLQGRRPGALERVRGVRQVLRPCRADHRPVRGSHARAGPVARRPPTSTGTTSTSTRSCSRSSSAIR